MSTRTNYDTVFGSCRLRGPSRGALVLATPPDGVITLGSPRTGRSAAAGGAGGGAAVWTAAGAKYASPEVKMRIPMTTRTAPKGAGRICVAICGRPCQVANTASR